MQWLVAGVYLILLTAAHGADQDTDGFCKAIDVKLKELKEATKSLCGANATGSWTIDRADYRQLVTWTSVDRTQIGHTNFRSTGTLSFEIPDIIPDDAIEVLIYTWFNSATSSGTTSSHFKIYTEGDDGEEYAKYTALITGSRSYYYSNTDNLWLPMPSSRRVFLHVPNALSGSINGHLYVIGYR